MDNRRVIKKTLILIKFKALGQDKAWYVQETEHEPYIRITENKQVAVKKAEQSHPSNEKNGHIFF